MKKYKVIIFIFALAGMMNSCGDDFLEKYPHSDVVAGAPATIDVVEQNVTGAYQILYFDCYAASLWMPVTLFFDVLADDLYPGGGNADDQPFLQHAAIYQCTSVLNASGWWDIFFSGLKRCNGALNAIENAVSGTEEQLARLKAETLALRAYYVHWLWKAYGNIPYFDKVWTEEPFAARQHTFDEIYPIIIADLDAAINEPAFPLTDKTGRVSKAMAMMTKARVVMYKQDNTKYGEVLANMKTIIESGDYKLITAADITANNFTGRLGSNSADIAPPTTNHIEWIFLRDGEFCSESIFEVNHDSNFGKGWGNAWSGTGNYLPRFIGCRDNAPDITFQAGWGFCSVREEAYAIFDADDYRREASINEWGNNSTYQNTGYTVRKHAARWGYNVGTRGDRDLGFENNKRIYRIAEAYLNAAELELAVGGGQGAAQPYLDAIRERAYGRSYSIPATLNNIKLERRRELFNEGLRFWDLLRWGTDENDRTLDVVLSTNNAHQTRTWDANKRFLPIPQSEIAATANTEFALKQNPGY